MVQQKQLQKFLKICLILTAIYLLPLMVNAQTQVYTTDTVCVGTLAKTYGVTNVSPTSTLAWSLSDPSMGTIDNTIISGPADSIIEIDWGMTSGSVILSVVETTIDGCVGDTVSLEIILMDLPTIALVGDTVCYDEATAIATFDLTGEAPWTITYDWDGNTYTTVATASPHVETLTGPHTASTTLTITNVEDSFCEADLTGLTPADIHVLPPVGTISQVYHLQ